MKIGYARVSTDEQSLALQLDALQADGCERVFQDTASGARSSRKGLADALQACAPGDVLTVWKLDRLGRSLLDLVGLVENLKARDVGLKVLTGAGASIDTTKPEGRLFFAPDQLAMAAQLIAGDRSQREVAKALGVAVSTLREGMKGQAEGGNLSGLCTGRKTGLEGKQQAIDRA